MTLAIDPSEVLPPNLRRDIPLAEALRFEAKRRALAAGTEEVRPPAVNTQRQIFGSPPVSRVRTLSDVAAAKWTPEEDDIIRALRIKGYSSSIIADHISGRTGPGVRARARLIGLKLSSTVRKPYQQLASKFKAPEIQVSGRLTRIQTIVSACANAYYVSYADIVGSGRIAEIVRPRHVAYYLAKTMTTRSLPEIGRAMGGRDHTTVLSGFRKIERLMQTDAILAEEIRIIRASLESPTATQSVAA